ncbi:MAG: helix-turn-helix transcriptional regulator [Haloarculaceae archaeon]
MSDTDAVATERPPADGPAREAVAYLSASSSRLRVFRAIADGVSRPGTLAEAAGVSRTTVHRCLNEFDDHGWVTDCADGYAVTAAGRAVLEGYADLLARVARADRYGPFLAAFDRADECPLPSEAEVAVAEPTDPHAPVEFLSSRLPDPEDVDRLVGFVPVVTPAFDRAYGPLIAAGVETDLVLPGAAFERAREAYPESVERAEAADNLTVMVTDREVEVGVSLFPEEVFLGAYGDDGQFRACLHTTDRDVRSWARELVDGHREAARPVA